MNRKAALSCLAALGLAMGLAGCSNNTSDVKMLGEPGAKQVFLYGIVPQNYAPIYGFDLAFVGPTGNFYLAESAVVPSIQTISTGQLSSFAQTSTLGGGDFVGSATDVVHEYEGGPNGVIEVNYTQIWAADDAHFTLTGSASPYTYTYTGDTTNHPLACDSSVKILNKNYPAGPYILYTNGCFKSDELGYGENTTTGQKWVLVANPEEDSTLATNTTGAPTAPFVTLINADMETYMAAHQPNGQTPDILPSSYVLAQIPFDGANNTPNATGGIEQPVYSKATGYFYVSVTADGASDTSNGAIAVIDPVNKVALAKIPLTNCSPSGMAIGPDGQEAFLACANSAGLQVVSLVASGSIAKGQVLATIPVAGATFNNGCDQAWYNPGLNQYMTACQPDYGSSGIISIVNAGSGLVGSSIKLAQTLDVGGAYTHSVASDQITGAIYVPLQPGDALCSSSVSSGCIGIWAPEGGALQRGIY